jgi:hypothetical protein
MLFTSLGHARAVLAAWQRDYHTQRPHSKLGWLTPAEFAIRKRPVQATAIGRCAARGLRAHGRCTNCPDGFKST